MCHIHDMMIKTQISVGESKFFPRDYPRPAERAVCALCMNTNRCGSEALD